MNKKFEMRMESLKNAGIDTDKYDYVVVLTPKEEKFASKFVEDKQIDNKAFRRWITAQTFRMLDYGWDAYLKNHYNYKYQFTMMLEELRVLNKLENKDKESFEERSRFFNKGVVVATCEHYMRQFDKYVREHYDDYKGYVRLARYGDCDIDEVQDIKEVLFNIIGDINHSENYAELYSNLKRFMKKMNKLPENTPKCSEWKSAFKGNGAYYSLKNMILYHDCLLRDCSNKQESISRLTYCLSEYKGEYWRFHYMLLDTIELNQFDLRDSIERHK